MKPKPYWITVGIILLVGLVLRVWLQAKLQSHFADDAYIFMRYVQNFGAGRGLVYNVGDRVIGYTSPLFVLTISGLHFILRPLPLDGLISLLNTMLFVVLVLVTALTRERFGSSAAFPLLLVFYFPYLDASMNGMETMLFVTCIVASVVSLTCGKTDLGLVLAMLAALTRPEGILLLGCVVAVLLWVRPPKIPIWGIALSVLLAALWLSFCFSYYGTVVPHSMLAKATPLARVQAQVGGPLDKYVLLALGFSSVSFAKLPDAVRLGLYAVGVASMPVIVLALLSSLRRRDAWAVFPLFFLSVWVFYCIGKPVSIWSWYTIPTSIAFAASLLPWLIERFSLVQTPMRRLGLEAAAALFCLATIAVGLPQRVQGERGMTARLFDEADYIKATIPQAKSLMVGDIGIVGYKTGLRIIDLAGLVSPEVTRKGADGQKLSFGALVQTDQPDVLLMREDPRDTDTILDGLNLAHTFTDAPEKARFDASYMLVDVNYEFFHPFIFVKRSLVSGKMFRTGTQEPRPALRATQSRRA